MPVPGPYHQLKEHAVRALPCFIAFRPPIADERTDARLNKLPHLGGPAVLSEDGTPSPQVGCVFVDSFLERAG